MLAFSAEAECRFVILIHLITSIHFISVHAVGISREVLTEIVATLEVLVNNGVHCVFARVLQVLLADAQRVGQQISRFVALFCDIFRSEESAGTDEQHHNDQTYNETSFSFFLRLGGQWSCVRQRRQRRLRCLRRSWFRGHNPGGFVIIRAVVDDSIFIVRLSGKHTVHLGDIFSALVFFEIQQSCVLIIVSTLRLRGGTGNGFHTIGIVKEVLHRVKAIFRKHLHGSANGILNMLRDVLVELERLIAQRHGTGRTYAGDHLIESGSQSINICLGHESGHTTIHFNG